MSMNGKLHSRVQLSALLETGHNPVVRLPDYGCASLQNLKCAHDLLWSASLHGYCSLNIDHRHCDQSGGDGVRSSHYSSIAFHFLVHVLSRVFCSASCSFTLFQSPQSSNSLWISRTSTILRCTTGPSISISKMEAPMVYRPSAGPIYGTNPRLVHFPPINNDDSQLLKRTSTAPPRKYHRNFFEVFPFLKAKRHERPILLKSEPDPPQKKAPLKTITQWHTPTKMESSVEASPYNWPHDGSLDPKTTALVIIDMQKDCTF
jgi:hypothetical protein